MISFVKGKMNTRPKDGNRTRNAPCVCVMKTFSIFPILISLFWSCFWVASPQSKSQTSPRPPHRTARLEWLRVEEGSAEAVPRKVMAMLSMREESWAASPVRRGGIVVVFGDINFNDTERWKASLVTLKSIKFSPSLSLCLPSLSLSLSPLSMTLCSLSNGTGSKFSTATTEYYADLSRKQWKLAFAEHVLFLKMTRDGYIFVYTVYTHVFWDVLREMFVEEKRREVLRSVVTVTVTAQWNGSADFRVAVAAVTGSRTKRKWEWNHWHRHWRQNQKVFQKR